MRYPPPVEPFMIDRLDDSVALCRTVSFPIEQVKSYNQTLKELAGWCANICGVKIETLCSFDLLKFGFEFREMKKKLSDYEAVINKYNEMPKRYWSSGSPSSYDPMSGFHGTVSGTTDDYSEARAAFKRWNP
jgi:hypothetical protein